MNWIVITHPSVEKFLKRISKNDWFRIKEALLEFKSNPFVGDIEKIKGKENEWRRRIGSYRVLYEVSIEKGLVLIFKIRRRTSKTY